VDKARNATLNSVNLKRSLQLQQSASETPQPTYKLPPQQGYLRKKTTYQLSEN